MIPFSTKFKIIISYIFYYSGVSYLFFRLSLLLGGVRVINYHCTPFYEKNTLENQFIFYNKYFTNFNITTNEYKNLLFCKPRIILTFDDGLRSNFDIAVPLLNKYHFTGIFFIPVNLIFNCSLDSLNHANIFPKQKYLDDRNLMDINELNILKTKHIIGSHTLNHYRFNSNDTYETIENEIINSKNKLNKLLNKDINTFAWVGGEFKHYTQIAFSTIKNNYKYIFSTNSILNFNINKVNNIGRLNIESSYNKQLFLFQMSGILDIFYLFKQFKLYNKIYKYGK
jgi:peptidoglycan/xylan/chitin deacetylase (PgdA/CDA1 family)